MFYRTHRDDSCEMYGRLKIDNGYSAVRTDGTT